MKVKQAHGIMGDASWELPKCVAKSDVANRADQGNQIKANEFMDSKSVLKEKMTLIAELVKKSKCLTAYTGAGLSRAAGIPDYASKATKSVVNAPKLGSSFDALPTYAHKVLVALERQGYLKHYVQQNHDGLPQKAGFPQEKINEIHGAWFDPSNPVVKFSGTLRSDLFSWMEEMEDKVDLCFCLGTSLSGMNADRMACTPAERACRGDPGILGTIIINLQQTHLDSQCSVRVWAKLDDAFSILADLLQLNTKVQPPKIPAGDVYQIPYGKDGLKNEEVLMEWDLRVGTKLVVAPSDASNHQKACTICGKDSQGNYICQFAKIRRRLGKWWIAEAIAGRVPYVPLANVSAKVKNVKKHEQQVEDVDKPITTSTTLVDKVESFFASIGGCSKGSAKEEEDDKVSTLASSGYDSAAAMSALHISDGDIDKARAVLEEAEYTSSEDEPPPTPPSGTKKKELPPFYRVVQSHHLVEGKKNQHHWGLSLSDPTNDDLSEIHEVIYHLHPTFRNPTCRVTKPPFALGRTGWGTFDVGVEIRLENGKVLREDHELTFGKNGDTVKETDLAT